MQINLDNIIKGYTGRLIILFGICLLGSFILVWRLWDVQIKNGPEYTKEVANQSIRKIRVSPVRGRISTSDNVIIADTEPQYNIVLHFSEMRQSGRNSRKKTITYILNLLEEIAENIGRINTVTKKKIQRHIYQYTAIPFNAFKDLTPRELARISEKMPKYKGLEIQIKYIRTYPLKKFFAHTLGFTGRRKPSQENLEEKRKAFYVFHEPSGRCGLEKTYDKTLRGKPGIHMVRIDISSYAHNKLPGGIPVENGNELILTINSKFQRAAEKALIGKTGSIVIVNCNSGEILAMASSPTYDLSKLTAKEYQRLSLDKSNHPLLNRAISAGYAPGSIIKPLIAMVALQNKSIPPGYVDKCPGYYKLGKTRIRCWKRSGHGKIGLMGAIEQSCNTYFIDIGIKTGLEKIQKVLTEAGIGQKTGIELLSEKTGTYPTRSLKQDIYKESWNAADTAFLSIGQGLITVSPLQMAMYAAAIANGGKLYKPYIVKKIVDSKGVYIKRNSSELRSQIKIDSYIFEIIREGMRRVIHGEHATAKVAQDCTIKLAGKTGTAQMGSGKKKYNNAWFICFGPFENPKYAAAIIIEHGVSGGKTAAPIGTRIFNEVLSD